MILGRVYDVKWLYLRLLVITQEDSYHLKWISIFSKSWSRIDQKIVDRLIWVRRTEFNVRLDPTPNCTKRAHACAAGRHERRKPKNTNFWPPNEFDLEKKDNPGQLVTKYTHHGHFSRIRIDRILVDKTF